MKRSVYILILSIFLFIPQFSYSAKGPGSTGFEFLNIPIGAREVGMGSGTAICHGPNAYWWNPAGLCFLGHKYVSLMYNKWFSGISQQRIGFSFPMKNEACGAINISMLSISDIEGYSWHDVPTGNITARDLYISYTQSKRFSHTMIGMTIKAISEKLEEESAFAVAFDIGGLIEPANDLWISAGVRNLGSSDKFIKESETLPMTIFSGAGVRLNKFILVSSDVLYLNSELKYGAGAELNIWSLLFFRIGWNNVSDLSETFRYGAGWKWLDISIDFAYAPYGKLGNTSRFDLNFKFGKLTLTESIYRYARKLYKSKNYEQAWIEFNKVNSLSPDYKKVNIWLNKTEDILKRKNNSKQPNSK